MLCTLLLRLPAPLLEQATLTWAGLMISFLSFLLSRQHRHDPVDSNSIVIFILPATDCEAQIRLLAIIRGCAFWFRAGLWGRSVCPMSRRSSGSFFLFSPFEGASKRAEAKSSPFPGGGVVWGFQEAGSTYRARRKQET